MLKKTIFQSLSSLSLSPRFLSPHPSCCVIATRGRKQWARKYYQELFAQQMDEGPEKLRHRSEWSNWNYDAEIFAFGKRLQEEFNEETLRRAFTHRSYIEQEEGRRKDLGITDDTVALAMQDNDQLAVQGEVAASDYVMKFLRFSYPHLPQPGIQAIHNYLVSDDMLGHVARNLGFKDLMLCADFPPEDATIIKTLKAVIGALLHDQGRTRADKFVQDVICTMLIGRDVNEFWQVTNPMGLLCEELEKRGMPPPEPRLLRGAGSQTVLACYVVGIYSHKQLIGQAPGESVMIAEEMAARDALCQLYRTTYSEQPLQYNAPAATIAEQPLQYNAPAATIVDTLNASTRTIAEGQRQLE